MLEIPDIDSSSSSFSWLYIWDLKVNDSILKTQQNKVYQELQIYHQNLLYWDDPCNGLQHFV